MAVATVLRDQVKDFASILTATTTFDSDITNYVAYAIKMLSPVALNEIDSTTITVNADLRTLTFPVGTTEVDELEMYDNDLGDYAGFNDYRVHGGYIKLDYAVPSGTVFRLWGLGDYTVTTIPGWAEIVVVYWALAMLYSSFAGDSRKYNAYVSTGATKDRDMKDSAEYYQQKGNDILADRTTLRGA